MERKVFAILSKDPTQPFESDQSLALHNDLVRDGFRRSQNILYKPACEQCKACISARVVVDRFTPTRSQRRLLKKNRFLSAKLRSPQLTDEQFKLLRCYLDARHSDGGMANMSLEECRSMAEETPVDTAIIEYRMGSSLDKDGRLIAASITDILDDGLSMVYSFFDPDLGAQSLGSFMILDHIRLARLKGLPYLYLGYWITDCSKMSYKTNYKPVELLIGGAWKSGTDETIKHVSKRSS
jgi:arginine-tRNA-protein transferase